MVKMGSRAGKNPANVSHVIVGLAVDFLGGNENVRAIHREGTEGNVFRPL